jgi:multidrug efflux system membrane fusion protein
MNEAERDSDRAKALFAAGLISRRDEQSQVANAASLEASVAVDRTLPDQAKLQLNYTKIIAPISGRIGLRAVDSGSFARSIDPTGLAMIPIDVVFNLPIDDLSTVMGAKKKGHLSASVYSGDGQRSLCVGHLVTSDIKSDGPSGWFASRLNSVITERNYGQDRS